MDQQSGSNIVKVGIDLSEFYLSVEWDILAVPATRNEEYYPCCEEPYSGNFISYIITNYFRSIGLKSGRINCLNENTANIFDTFRKRYTWLRYKAYPKINGTSTYRIAWNPYRRRIKRNKSAWWQTNCTYQVIWVGLMLYIKYSELERWQKTMTFNLERNVWLRRLYSSRGCCRCCFYIQLLCRILKVFLLMFFSVAGPNGAVVLIQQKKGRKLVRRRWCRLYRDRRFFSNLQWSLKAYNKDLFYIINASNASPLRNKDFPVYNFFKHTHHFFSVSILWRFRDTIWFGFVLCTGCPT